MRISEAALALFARPGADGDREFLTQWNEKWQAYSLIGGAREPGESFRECCIREVVEELELVPGQDFRIATTPVGERMEYIAFSAAAKTDTQYRIELYRAWLTPQADLRVASHPENRWIRESRIMTGCTEDGRPIADQVRRSICQMTEN